jgi:hypothetical protein
MQVFLAHVVECADDAALEDAPEALNRVGVNRTDNTLLVGMIYRNVRECLVEIAVARPLISTGAS